MKETRNKSRSRDVWRVIGGIRNEGQRDMGKLTWFMVGVVTGLSAAAIGQELAKPPEERTWKGKVAGVPYNFRVQDWTNIATEYWNPESDTVMSPHAIGLGWGINFAALVQRAQSLVESRMQSDDATAAKR